MPDFKIKISHEAFNTSVDSKTTLKDPFIYLTIHKNGKFLGATVNGFCSPVSINLKKHTTLQYENFYNKYLKFFNPNILEDILKV